MSGVELSRLISDGDLDNVKLLLETGAKEEIKKYVEYKSKFGDSPLHLASIKGNLEIMKLLIFHGADVNSMNDSGNTPLIWASKFGYLEIVKLLIDNNADINSKNNFDNTPLIIAKKNKHSNIVNYISGVELLIYLTNGDLKQAEDLLEKTADIDTQHKDKMGNTFLHLASSRGYLKIVKILIDNKKFDINVKNNDGYTPLHSAAEGGHLDVIKYLIGNNGDINIKNSDGDTAIVLAIQNNYADKTENSHFNIVKYLFDNKDKINLTYGYNPLITIAEKNENDNVKEYFTKKYADINIANDKRKIELIRVAQVPDSTTTTVDKLISEILAAEGISFDGVLGNCKTKFGKTRTRNVYDFEDFDKYDRFLTFSDGYCYSFEEIKNMHKGEAKKSPFTNLYFDEFDLYNFIIVIELLGLITDSKTQINVYDNARNNNPETKNNERNNDTKNERKGGYIKSKKTKKSRKNKTKKGKTKKNKKKK